MLSRLRGVLVGGGLLVLAAACQPTPTPPPVPTIPPPTPTAVMPPQTGQCPAGSTRTVVYGTGKRAALDAVDAASAVPQELKRDLSPLNAVVVCASASTVAGLDAAGVQSEPDRVMSIFLGAGVAAEPREADQWGLSDVGARSAWSVGRGAGVTIAIIDSGVDASHPDIGALVWDVDLIGTQYPRHAHATHVAAIAAGRENGVGVVGVAPDAMLASCRVCDSNGSCWTSDIASCVVTSADRGASVINMSLGGPSTEKALDDAIAYAVSKGVTVVAAAGNEGTNAPSYPAASAGVIGVGAIDQARARAGFSNFGQPDADIAAPGVDILSAVPPFGWEAWAGTSMAAPFVAGAAAILRGLGALADVLPVLLASGNAGPSDLGGKRVSAANAVKAPTITPGPSPSAAPIPTRTVHAYPGPPTEASTLTPSPPAMTLTPVNSATATSPRVPPTATGAPSATSRLATTTSSATSTATAHPIATLTPRPTATPCTIDAYTRVNGTPAYRPVYAPCLTPTATRR